METIRTVAEENGWRERRSRHFHLNGVTHFWRVEGFRIVRLRIRFGASGNALNAFLYPKLTSSAASAGVDSFTSDPAAWAVSRLKGRQS